MVRAVDELLQVLCIKGRAKPDSLAAAVDVDVAAVIEQCEQAGLVENTKLGYRVTDVGRSRADERYAAERLVAGPVIEDVYEAFLPINDQVKQIVTDWQLREVDGTLVLNDHGDAAYDARVVARLHGLDGEITEALALALVRAATLRGLRVPAAAGARSDRRRRSHDGRRPDQGQLPHRVVRAPRGADRPLRPPARRVTPRRRDVVDAAPEAPEC